MRRFVQSARKYYGPFRPPKKTKKRPEMSFSQKNKNRILTLKNNACVFVDRACYFYYAYRAVHKKMFVGLYIAVCGSRRVARTKRSTEGRSSKSWGPMQ